MLKNSMFLWLLCLILILTGCSKSTLAPVESTPSETTLPDTTTQQDLLTEYVFYTGIATVWEDQYWESKFQDGTHGEGDAILTSEDFLVFDPATQKLYIVARTLTYTSKHTITVNDLNGNFLRTAYVNASGDLNEYYGQGTPIDNTVDFTTLPVRIDVSEQVVITRPPTNHQSWVAYRSTADTVRLGIDRVMPPDSADTPDLSQMPNLAEIKDEKTYGNRESRVYEATTRLWNLKGSFDYQYRQISYDDFYSAIEHIKDDSMNQNDFASLAESLPAPWPETAAIGDHMENIASASTQFSNAIDAIENAHSASSDRINDILQNNPEIRSNLEKMSDDAQADQSALRKLEGVVMESSDSDLINAYNVFFPSVEATFSNYRTLIGLLKSAYDAGDITELKNIAQKIKNQNANALLQLELLRDKLETTSADHPLEPLIVLFNEWPELIPKTNVSVDIEGSLPIPEGYPLDLLPILENAKIVLAETIPPESGGPSGFALTLKSNLDETDIIAYYQDLLESYSDFEKVGMSGMTVLSASHPPYALSVMLTPNTLGGDERFMIVLSLGSLD